MQRKTQAINAFSPLTFSNNPTFHRATLGIWLKKDEKALIVLFLVRFIGYLCLIAGFAMMVIDGARMIAGGLIDFTSLRRLWALMHHKSLNGFESQTLAALPPQLHIWLIDPLLGQPAASIFLILGIIFVLVGLKRDPSIGFKVR